jgi:gliding motility-associated-like protein
MKIKKLLLGLAVLFTSGLFAQPCLNGWAYRSVITVDNTTNVRTLENHQIKLTLNTQTLVANGKAKANGNDLRIVNNNGILLDFWIENGTYNTANTVLWIKADHLPAAANTTIYLFYGNEDASAVANGDLTFELFDDFSGNTLNTSKWYSCGTNAPVVGGGAIQFTSETGNKNSIIKSQFTYTDTLISEMYVNTVSEGIAFIGQNDLNDDGWALAFETAGFSTEMKVVKQTNGGLECVDLSNQSPNAGIVPSTVNTQGLWSFTWNHEDQQSFDWPGGSTQDRTDNNLASLFSAEKQISIGTTAKSDLAEGDLSLDWMRLRKYTYSQPTTTLGVEAAVVLLSTSNSGPYCTGDNIQLSASTYTGATYAWFGPNGYTSTDQNPTITGATTFETGTYEVTVTNAGSCSAISSSTIVSVSEIAVGGTITGGSTVCKTANAGTLTLAGENGQILYWQESTSTGGPWATLNNTLNTLGYVNLTSTMYYRAIVKSGNCNQDTSSIDSVVVDEITVGGNTLGAIVACADDNSGIVELINEVGSINKWEISINNGGTWTDVINETNILNYSVLAITSQYRAEVQNGVCAAQYSQRVEITINPRPIVSFTAPGVCQGINTVFENTTTVDTGSVKSYTWDYGNGAGSTVAQPNYNYKVAGTYSARLIAETYDGCTDSLRINVSVYPLPEVNFGQATVCENEAMVFQDQTAVASGTLDLFHWDFDDVLSTSSLQNPSYTFSAAGSFEVKLKVTTNNSCVDSLTKSVQVNPRAVVSFVSDSVCQGLTNYFQNTTQTSSTLMTYNWDFGDGGSSSLSSPNYTYLNAGTYTVSLTATAPGACVDVATETVVVFPKPVANFTTNDNCQYDSIVFVNTSTVLTGTYNSVWNFDDGAVSRLEDVNHLYNTPGEFLVSLDLTTDKNCIHSVSKTINVFELPMANFTFANVCDEINLPFINTSSISTGSITYNWDFGDLSTATILDPSHLYALDGTYTVEMIATSNNNCTDTIAKTVTVHPLPIPQFSATVSCDGTPTVFTNTTTINIGSVKSYTWNFDDGMNSIVVDPVHQYLNPGGYNVELTAISYENCFNAVVLSVSVSDLPVPNFEALDKCLGATSDFINRSTIALGSLSYVWNFGDDSTANQTDPSHLYGSAGLYPVKLIATSNLGCIDSITKYIEVFALPVVDAGRDTSVSQGFGVELSGYALGGVDYNWTPIKGLDDNTIPHAEASPLETTEYTLTVTDLNGCIAADEIVVNVILDYKLFIQNVITPDGNGENDYLEIVNIKTFKNTTLYIYDRFGLEVYQKRAYQNDWNGTKGNDQLPDGTYYYIVTFDDSTTVYKGAITILRNR